MIGRENLGSRPVKVIFFSPRRFPTPLCLVAIKPTIVIYRISIPVNLVILIDLPIVFFTSLKDDRLGSLGFCEVEVIECNPGWSGRVSSKRWVGVLYGSQKLIIIAKKNLPNSSGGGQAVESD